MKTSIKSSMLVKVMVIAALVFAGVSNSKVSAQENKYYSNVEMTGDLITTKTIYKKDGALARFQQYKFTYDEQKRVLSKEILKWNSLTEKWIPSFKLNYAYMPNQISILLANWDKNTKSYNSNKKMAIYQLSDSSTLVSCVNYDWNHGKWSEINTNKWAMNIPTNIINNTGLMLAGE